MRTKNVPSLTLSCVNVVKRECKEKTISDFIETHLATCLTTGEGGGSKPAFYLLLARSPASPVATALAALSHEIHESGVSLRVIFSQIGSGDSSNAWINGMSPISFARDVRVITNNALLEAHEQLVLGPATSWAGDTMRREPTKSDAYECYSPDSRPTARCAQVAFDRLWVSAKSVATHGAESAQDVANAVAIAAVDGCGAAQADEAVLSAMDDSRDDNSKADSCH